MTALTDDEVILWKALFDASGDGMVVLRLDGSVYRANPQYAEMLGYSPEEMTALHVWDWDLNFTPEELREMLRAVDRAGAHIETRQRRKDGDTIDVELTNSGALY
ncbi:MAG: PAS domain S-box protein [Pseudohongiellaceae bacterium]